MSGAHPQSSDLSLVIRNARIIDGTGSPAFTGDVGVD